jgi:hypothetical protein
LFVIGFLFLFSWISLLVQLTSSNTSFWVRNVFADLHFYNSERGDPYNWSQITSPLYPLETIYERIRVTFSPSPKPPEIRVDVNNIIIHSH